MTICYTDRTINGNMAITKMREVSGDASLNHVTVNSLSGNVTGNFVGDVTGTVSSLSNHNTDDLAEGSHKYYDDSLVNTYLEGGSHVGVTFNNGAMSIGQSVRPDNSPTFKAMTLTDVNDASYGLIDFKHDYGAVATSFPPITGIYTMAQIKGNIESGGNGGELSFHTKANNGALGERLRISDTGTGNSNTNFDNKTLLAMNGMLKLERNDAGATSKDTYIYNSMDSTNVDLNIETRTDMGVSFMAEGTTRMRIAEDGNVGIGTTTPTAKLDVSGSLTVTGTMNVGSLNISGALGVGHTGQFGATNVGAWGAVLTSNGTGVAASWNLPVVVAASFSSYGSANFNADTKATIVCDNVDIRTVSSSYDTSTGIFTAPRNGDYKFDYKCLIADFVGDAFGRVRSELDKKTVGGSFAEYSIDETYYPDYDTMVGMARSSMIIRLSQGEQIRHRVMGGQAGATGTYSYRGDAFHIRGTYHSVHSIILY